MICQLYTDGIYFEVKDNIFIVIDNGGGKIVIFNIDGSVYKILQTSMDYIENAKIIRESVGEWAKSMMIILINSIELNYIRAGC